MPTTPTPKTEIPCLRAASAKATGNRPAPAKRPIRWPGRRIVDVGKELMFEFVKRLSELLPSRQSQEREVGRRGTTTLQLAAPRPSIGAAFQAVCAVPLRPAGSRLRGWPARRFAAPPRGHPYGRPP